MRLPHDRCTKFTVDMKARAKMAVRKHHGRSFYVYFAIVSMIMFPSKRARGHTGTESMISLFVFLVQDICGQM